MFAPVNHQWQDNASTGSCAPCAHDPDVSITPMLDGLRVNSHVVTYCIGLCSLRKEAFPFDASLIVHLSRLYNLTVPSVTFSLCSALNIGLCLYFALRTRCCHILSRTWSGTSDQVRSNHPMTGSFALAHVHLCTTSPPTDMIPVPLLLHCDTTVQCKSSMDSPLSNSICWV